jgi:mono/diheme cytochrome c family protein
MSPGERVFRDQSCGSCHTLAAADAKGTAAKKLDGANLSVARVRAAVIGGAKGMPEYVLSASDLKALSQFVATASRAR